MNASGMPILLTSSAIAYDKNVKLTDTKQRIQETINSVEQWIRISPNSPIVICDGSGFDFNELIIKKFPNQKIEIIYFQNNISMIEIKGRGYGEGAIIDYAIKNSRVIKESGHFAKCTAKLWVNNFYDFFQKYREGRMLFKGVFSHVFHPLKTTEFSYIDTRFYITDTKNYLKYFNLAHEFIDFRTGYGLEDAFRDILIKNEIKHSLSLVYPVISGVGGGTGIHYKNTPRRLFKEKIRLEIVRRNKNFQYLFND